MKKQTTRAPTYDDLLAIAKLIESGSHFSEFRLRSGDIEVEVKRAPSAIGSPSVAAVAAPGMTSTGSPSVAKGAAPEPLDLPGIEIIRSPMVGTFYRSPAPGEKPFVAVGSKVKADSILCIIEVMKLMNSVNAGFKGEVTHIFVEDAQAVLFGQALIGIRKQDRARPRDEK